MIYLLLLCLVANSFANKEEKDLLEYVFDGYDKTTRPIKDYEEPVIVEMGLGVQTLESFNQMEESLALNIWLRSNWKDENLAWYNHSNLTFLSINKEDIWTPDIELLNAASKPEIYTLKGGINLYSDGSIMYSKPGIYKYSCSLNLKRFPFDKQNCTMKFGNWIYSNQYVYLKPYEDKNRQVDILDSFSHSEWDIENVEVYTKNETKECCPGEEYNTLYYSFILKRYPHYYKISMGMTITLVVVSFIISLMSPDNVSRTGTAVFIPLTILALQLTIASKIPVVGYFTLMDQFFLCCFITSMICSIESGLVYALITAKSQWFFNLVDRLGICKVDDDEISLEEGVTVEETDIDEFEETINELDNTSKNIKRSQSYTEGIRRRVVDHNEKTLMDEINLEVKNKNKEIDGEENNFGEGVYRVIDFDDKRLELNDKERKIDAKIFKFITRLDNTIRILLPIVFFSLIIYIFSFEEK